MFSNRLGTERVSGSDDTVWVSKIRTGVINGRHPANGIFELILFHENCSEVYTQHSSSICLAHWGRVTYICVNKLTTFGSNNGLSAGRRQAMIWIDARILLIGPLGTDCSEILIET